MLILRGRGFAVADREGTPRGSGRQRDARAGTVRCGRPARTPHRAGLRGEEQRPFTIVGVVRDSKYNDLREDRVSPMMWVPIVQAPFPVSSVALRTLPGGEARACPSRRRRFSDRPIPTSWCGRRRRWRTKLRGTPGGSGFSSVSHQDSGDWPCCWRLWDCMGRWRMRSVAGRAKSASGSHSALNAATSCG